MSFVKLIPEAERRQVGGKKDHVGVGRAGATRNLEDLFWQRDMVDIELANAKGNS
jgi:hypothetical protein